MLSKGGAFATQSFDRFRGGGSDLASAANEGIVRSRHGNVANGTFCIGFRSDSVLKMISPTLKCDPTAPVLVGVEVSAGVIRSAVFSSSFEVLGKTKLSTKPERGFAAVAERIERCVRYAIDECDLDISSVEAIGVGLPGFVDRVTSKVTAETEFQWKEVPLREELASRLGVPVCLGNAYALASWAIYVMESPHDGEHLGTLFPGPTMAAGLVMAGEVMDLSEFPVGRPLLPGSAASVVSQSTDARFRLLRPRDLRKSVRKGNERMIAFLESSVRESARFGVRLVQQAGVRRLVLAGGAVDENKTEMIKLVRETLQSGLDASDAAKVEVVASELGDLAFLMGSALAAARLMHHEAPTQASPTKLSVTSVR